MGRRSRKAAWHAAAGEPTAAREELERRWRDRLQREPRLATMVTAQGASREPYHCWLHYRQGFSPALVRLFLKECELQERGGIPPSILDPFAGSGTTVVECARRGVPAIGVEPLASLVFLAGVKKERDFPPLPDLGDAAQWKPMADSLSAPVHRAALMLAVERQHTAAGQLNKNARPLPALLVEVAAMMREDLSQPLPRVNPITRGDARRLDGIDDESMGGILTSPPYLSRYDYTQIVSPIEAVYRYWYSDSEECDSRAGQVRAHPRATVGPPRSDDSPFDESCATGTARLESVSEAVRETCAWLAELGKKQLAAVARDYFADLFDAVAQCARVLRVDAPCWMVVGGARVKGVYIPSDLIVAEFAEAIGLRVGAIHVARDLIDARRKFGAIGPVAPRESVLVMRKA